MAQTPELLEPEKAFAFSAKVTSADTIEAKWDIVNDYYMYRDKFRFSVEGEAVQLGDPKFPKGKMKQDEFFGEMEVYEHPITVEIPVIRSSDQSTPFTLVVVGQGCNLPVGICYPPLTQKANLVLPAKVAAVNAAIEVNQVNDAKTDAVNTLRSLIGGAASQPEFLPVDQAYQYTVDVVDPSRLTARFRIADGYYLYRDKTKFTKRSGDVELLSYELPEGKPKVDEYLGETSVYYSDVEIQLPLGRTDTQANSISMEVEYQGCADKGICYPPQKKTIALNLPEIISSAQAAEIDPVLPGSVPGKTSLSVGTTAFWAIVFSAFGVGILLTFTPCVLPMIPILSSIIVGQQSKKANTKGGLLSVVYVLGTAVTWTGVGVFAGLTGDQLQAYFQNVWAIGIVSGIFVLMALSMFGLYEIQMPSFIQSRLQERSQKLKGGTLGWVFVLGLISALLVGACVSPLLISILSVAISKGDPVLGGAVMFSMAVGMGIFLIALGFGVGWALPKAGAWMERVKQGFGVLLIAVAIYMLGVLPEVPVLLLWSILLIVTAVYMGATQALPEGASGWRYFWKGAGTVFLVWGVLALIGGLAGNRDILNPLPVNFSGGMNPFSSTNSNPVPDQLKGNGSDSSLQSATKDVKSVDANLSHSLFQQVASMGELNTQFARAKSAGKPVIVDYYADWCVDCVRMEKTTFQNPQVNKEMRERFILLQVDVTDPNDDARKVVKKYHGVYGPPAMLFFNSDGSERRDMRIYGYQNAEEFIQLLNKI
ncbi:protein-disulfide reductase DsbD [Pseudomonadota bacterium]